MLYLNGIINHYLMPTEGMSTGYRTSCQQRPTDKVWKI